MLVIKYMFHSCKECSRSSAPPISVYRVTDVFVTKLAQKCLWGLMYLVQHFYKSLAKTGIDIQIRIKLDSIRFYKVTRIDFRNSAYF
jgi:hypothetical protein